MPVFAIAKYISRMLGHKSYLHRPYEALKIGLISDILTESSLLMESRVRIITPENYRKVLRDWRPDLVFVESAWQGHKNSWKYKIASYADHPERTNDALKAVVSEARNSNIPAVFWNKEDDVHYERFIASASLFDFIFTVDSNCLRKYSQDAPKAQVVQALMFPVQPAFHNPDVPPMRRLGHSSFIGSYGTHVHARRREWQDMLFRQFASYGLDIYDRNSTRRAAHYRYPDLAGMRVRPRVAYPLTARIYKSYRFNLNVNTVENSPTMFSRRLIEILAVGGVAISTPSNAVESLFGDYCTVVRSPQEIGAVIEWSEQEVLRATERARAGAELIAKHHTWSARLRQLEDAGVF
jgi:hypothetical protein